MGKEICQVDGCPLNVERVNSRDVIEGSRRFARQSNKLMIESVISLDAPLPLKNAMISPQAQSERMNLVMDCFNTGAAEMLKLLHGDNSPEPWTEDYNHEERLKTLLESYGLYAWPVQKGC